MSRLHITYTRSRAPTGKIRFIEKRSWFRRWVVLEIEWRHEEQERDAPAIRPLPENGWVGYTGWFKAQPMDLSDPKLRWLFEERTA